MYPSIYRILEDLRPGSPSQPPRLQHCGGRGTCRCSPRPPCNGLRDAENIAACGPSNGLALGSRPRRARLFPRRWPEIIAAQSKSLLQLQLRLLQLFPQRARLSLTLRKNLPSRDDCISPIMRERVHTLEAAGGVSPSMLLHTAHINCRRGHCTGTVLFEFSHPAANPGTNICHACVSRMCVTHVCNECV